MREPLLGIYALTAEWRALMDSATELGVARIKLAWWRDEMGRFGAGAPVHPVTRFLAELPGADPGVAAQLAGAVDAADAQISGAPLELAAGLRSHADALYGVPLRVAAQLGRAGRDRGALGDCTAALGTAEYLARAIADYGREARVGRIPFPIDQLLAAGIENEDLIAAPTPRLMTYLGQLRRRAAEHYSIAATALPRAERPELRHLAVLAALGLRYLNRGRNPSSADFRPSDLYNAWSAARRAAAAR